MKRDRPALARSFLVAATLLVSLFGCASTPRRTTAAVGPISTASEPTVTLAALIELESTLNGLADFERRARQYTPAEWQFVLGYAHFRHGRYRAADQAFAKAADEGLSLLADHLLYFRGATAVALERDDSALQFFAALEEGYPQSVWRVELLLPKARALIALKRFDEARRALARFRKEGPARHQEEAAALEARSFIEEGARATAVARVRELLVHAGSEAELADALDLARAVKRRFGVDLTAWLDEPLQQYRLAQSFFERSQWDEAAVRLQRLLDQGALDAGMRVRARWVLARCLRWMHRYDEAVALFEELRRDPAARGMRTSVTAALATTYAKQNDYGQAIALREVLVRDASPRSRLAGSLTYKIAYLLMDEGRYREAIPQWKRALGMRLSRREQALARWNLAWCHSRLGEDAKAIAVLDRLLRREARRARIEDRVQYWKGRILERGGKRPAARALYREIAEKSPTGYYAELARRRLAGAPVATIPAFVAASWEGGAPSRWRPDGEVPSASDLHLVRAEELFRLGLPEEAGRELAAVDLRRHPELADRVMWLAFQSYDYDRAWRIAARWHKGLLRDDCPASDGFERFVWQVSYPEAYAPAVEGRAAVAQLDPRLIWSIMRTESAYRPEVISSAGAVGLMQLIPTTANRMARQALGEPIDRRELFRPTINIALGVEYLKTLFELFPDNPVAVIASYNAGEEAVGRWIENGTLDDVEAWIEEIPYAETNLYVKKVLRAYWIFQRMYPPPKRQKAVAKR